MRMIIPQISTTDRTHARTGPDKQRAQAHNHTRNPDAPHVHTHTHTRTSRHITSGSATPTRERSRQGNHRLRDLHRPLRRRLRPLPPLLLHLPLPPNLVELEAGEARELPGRHVISLAGVVAIISLRAGTRCWPGASL